MHIPSRILQISDSVEYFLGDALGSVRQVVNSQGFVRTGSYTPYGERLGSNVLMADTRFGFTGEMSDAGLLYLRARHYDPEMGRFTTRDTWGGDANQPMSYNAWLYGLDNPSRYTDPSGHYGAEVHRDLTHDMVYAAALGQAMMHGGSDFEEAMVFVGPLATQVAQADDKVDHNLADSSLPRPGLYALRYYYLTYTCLALPVLPVPVYVPILVYVSIPVYVPTTLHWYTTPEAETALESAETPEEFGRFLHAYQDSFSHWQKTGKPGTPGEIWDAHARNDRYLACVHAPSLCDPHNSIDYFDPVQNTVHEDWAIIDRNMMEGMRLYIMNFVRDEWESWNEE